MPKKYCYRLPEAEKIETHCFFKGFSPTKVEATHKILFCKLQVLACRNFARIETRGHVPSRD